MSLVLIWVKLCCIENSDTSETFSQNDLHTMSTLLKSVATDLIEIAFPMCRASSVSFVTCNLIYYFIDLKLTYRCQHLQKSAIYIGPVWIVLSYCTHWTWESSSVLLVFGRRGKFIFLPIWREKTICPKILYRLEDWCII